MKRLIVGSIDTLSVAGVVVLLLVGAINGYLAGGFIGVLIGLIVAFVIAVIVFGALFVLLEMNDHLRAIRKSLEGQARAGTGV